MRYFWKAISIIFSVIFFRQKYNKLLIYSLCVLFHNQGLKPIGNRKEYFPTDIFSRFHPNVTQILDYFPPKIKNQRNTLFEFERRRLATSASFTYASKVRHKGTLFDNFYEGFAHRTKKNSLFRTDARNGGGGNKAPETLFFRFSILRGGSCSFRPGNNLRRPIKITQATHPTTTMPEKCLPKTCSAEALAPAVVLSFARTNAKGAWSVASGLQCPLEGFSPCVRIGLSFNVTGLCFACFQRIIARC